MTLLSFLLPISFTLACRKLSFAALFGALGYNYMANTNSGESPARPTLRGIIAASRPDPLEALALACTADGDLPNEMEPSTLENSVVFGIAMLHDATRHM